MRQQQYDFMGIDFLIAVWRRDEETKLFLFSDYVIYV